MSTTGTVKPITMTDPGPVPMPVQYQQPVAPTPSFPGPPSYDPRLLNQQSFPQSISTQTTHGLKAARTATEYSLREFVMLQQRRRYDDPAAENRLRMQKDVALADLKTLRNEVATLLKASESHRWGRWALGGFLRKCHCALRGQFQSD
ncbi:hypothetical protein TruAng_002108 [Truncatella angustata]|nr:hypothetical protein TruAng_002108 [Truncatella angustata]